MLKTGMKAPVLLRAAASALRKQHSSSDARFISQTWQRLGRPRLALRRLSEPRYFRQQASQLKMATASLGEKKKLVFLGTPEVAAKSLALLLDAASKPEASFEVAGVVSQPASRRGRNRELLPSPVAALAAQRGIAGDRIVTPEVARDADFLMWLEDLGPDLCVTAAYGLILPKTFLAIPARGTLNIHPSLLPDYRGAAPVQRCLQVSLSHPHPPLYHPHAHLSHPHPHLSHPHLSHLHPHLPPSAGVPPSQLATVLLTLAWGMGWGMASEGSACPLGRACMSAVG
eukprot:jgi/Botrbrau1/19797/Bobra.0124s0045.1